LGRCIMWNLGKLQVFPAGSSPPRNSRGRCTAKRNVNDIWEESERPAEPMLAVLQCHF